MRELSWEPFDPTWLADAAEAQLPGNPEIAHAIRDCHRCFKRSVAGWYFVDPSNANRPGAAWQFARNICIDGGDYGQLVLDVLKDGRIGGVEFLDRIADLPRTPRRPGTS